MDLSKASAALAVSAAVTFGLFALLSWLLKKSQSSHVQSFGSILEISAIVAIVLSLSTACLWTISW